VLAVARFPCAIDATAPDPSRREGSGGSSSDQRASLMVAVFVSLAGCQSAS